MRFRFIEAERTRHAIARPCQGLGIPRAGSDAWKERGTSRRDRADGALQTQIETIVADSYGVHDGLAQCHNARRRTTGRVSECAIGDLNGHVAVIMSSGTGM